MVFHAGTGRKLQQRGGFENGGFHGGGFNNGGSRNGGFNNGGKSALNKTHLGLLVTYLVAYQDHSTSSGVCKSCGSCSVLCRSAVRD